MRLLSVRAREGGHPVLASIHFTLGPRLRGDERNGKSRQLIVPRCDRLSIGDAELLVHQRLELAAERDLVVRSRHPQRVMTDEVGTVLHPGVALVAPAGAPRILDQPGAARTFAIVPADDGDEMCA